MSALYAVAIAGGLTLLLSLVLPVAVRPLLVRLGIMDVPNERSSHTKPVLRGLGLAVLIAVIVGGGVGVWLLSTGLPFQRWDLLLVVLLGSVMAGLLGLGEDLLGLSVKVRSVCLLLIGLLVPVALVLLFSFPPVGGSFAFVAGFQWQGWDVAAGGSSVILAEASGATPLPLWLGIVLLPYALLFVSSYINVANFMDGLNGISGFHGLVAGLTFAAAGWLTGLPWLVIAGIVIAAGFAGFLPWNLTKPGAFLGDVGSYLLGGAIAITSFAALLAGVPILATIGPMVIYFGDVGVTLVKRVRAGHKWDEPHKEHVYQRIQQLGYSHVQASGMTTLASVGASGLGLVSCVVAPGWWLLLLAGGLGVLVVYLALPRLLPRRTA